MATIQIDDLRPVGADLFMDSESFMNDLDSDELSGVSGGNTTITWTIGSSVGCATVIATVSLGWVTYQVSRHYIP